MQHCIAIFISFLRWMIQLGRINIIAKLLLLKSHVALHRERYLEPAVHIMTQIGQRFYPRLACHMLCPEIDHSDFNEYDWLEFYKKAKEAVTANAPEP